MLALVALAFVLAASLTPTTADATTARAISVASLVSHSRYVVLATPVDSTSRWENVAGRRRIVTYTRLSVEGDLNGKAEGSSELMVRTLGGRVGNVGQIAFGEARLEHGQRSVLFLHESRDGTLAVTGMAQGHYPVVADGDDAPVLKRSGEVPELHGKGAVHQLPGRTPSETEALVRKAMKDAR